MRNMLEVLMYWTRWYAIALVCYVTAFARASGSGSKVQNQ
jgi:hypothetical protein